MKKVPMKQTEWDWKHFNEHNINVFPFQEWELAETISKHYLFYIGTRQEFPVFFEFFKNEKPIMIAPLDRRLSLHGCRYKTFAAAASIAFQDFIYPDEIADADVKECLDLLRKKCGSIRFERISPHSKLYKFLSCTEPLKQHINVRIPLKETYENYFAGLSKHVRQNIRTAYNRMIADGHVYSVEKIVGGGISQCYLDEIMNIYIDRRRSKYKAISSLHEWFLRHYHFNTIALSNQANSLYIILKIDNKVASFLAGYISKDKEYVLVPRLAINEEYKRYSPGVVIVNESMKIIEELGIKYLDLSKGIEKYKLDMGGEIYYTYDFSLNGTT